MPRFTLTPTGRGARGLCSRIAMLFFVGALLVLGCSRKPPARPLSAPLSIGAYYWPGQYWVDIANAKGWFREAGLDVKVIDTNPDYFASLKDVVAGRLDSQCFSLFDVLVNNAAGADLVVVLNSDNSNGSDAIIANSAITRVAELRGKRIGAARGTYQEYVLSVELQREGLSLADVTLVDVPGEKGVDELVRGGCDAVVAWEPLVTEALEKIHGNKLFDTREIPGLAPFGYVFQRKFIDQRPGDVTRFVEVWRRATDFIAQHPAEAFAVVAQVNHKTVEEVAALAKLDRILDDQDNQAAFSYAAGFDSLHGTSRLINDFLVKNKLTDKRLDSARFLDGRFVRSAR